MRNMSFALTTDQILAGSKTVTRRMGWRMLKPGDLIQPVRKCMGLKPGEKIERLRAPVRIVNTRVETLDWMLIDVGYGIQECAREGFPGWTAFDFVQMFCATHKGCVPHSLITRIEFEYTNADQA